MVNKQKQIEQMVKTMGNWAQRNNMCWNDGHAKSLAEALSEEYQPKISENAVVLAREEQQKYAAYKIIEPQIRGCLDREEKLEKQVRELDKELNLAKSVLSHDDERPLEKWAEHLRKETAEKFAERVKMAFYYEFDELIPSIMADKIDEICKEFTGDK